MILRAVALLALALASCKGTKTRAQLDEAWDQTKKNVPVVIVAVLLYPVGLPVLVVGVVGTNVITDVIDEKADYTTGDVVTKEQLMAELKRWQTKERLAGAAATAASQAQEWLKTIVEYCIFATISAFLIWLHWRNRHNWATYGYWKGVWMHGVLGGAAGVAEKNKVLSRIE